MGMSTKQVSSDHLELNWSTQNMLTSSEKTTIQSSSSNPLHHSTNNLKRSLQTQQQQQQQQQPDNNNTLKCPRCDSSNTKFCYYNNYNKTQPRHYCKACKRHWTKGGTLRNVPVGGGRKNKRIKRPNNGVNITTTSTTIDDHNLGFSDHHQKYIFPQDNNKNKGLLFNKPSISSEFDQVSWNFNNGGDLSTNQNLGFVASSHNQNLGFLINSLSMTSSMMDTNTIIPTSYSTLLSGFKDDSTATTATTTATTTTRMMMSNSSNVTQPWMENQTPSNNILEPNNFWTWNEIDYMVQGDMINKPFEDMKQH